MEQSLDILNSYISDFCTDIRDEYTISPQYYKNHDVHKGLRNSDGTGSCHAVKSARKLLPELWDGYLTLLALAPSVSDGLEGYNAEYDRLEGEILALRERKAGMKRALKAGTTDNRSYQREVSPILDGIEQLKRQQWDLFENMFHLDARCGYTLANKMEILRSITGMDIK